MQMDFKLVAGGVICFLPAVLTLGIVVRIKKAARRFKKTPFKDLQRRPAGEALRLKLDELNDQLNDQMLGLAASSVLLALIVFFQHPNWFGLTLCLLLSAGFAALFGTKLFKTLGERQNCQLGFEGERFVGEELSRLIALGFEIYHDVPFENFNIDHVLVGPRGIFAVETKMRRKPVTDDGKTEYRVQFDGKALQWPWGFDTQGVEQAQNNARTLALWLSSATGDKHHVTPVLTLPGWMVERKTPGNGFHVTNPKEIYKICAAQPATLGEPEIKRAIYQLNQKCRIEMT